MSNEKRNKKTLFCLIAAVIIAIGCCCGFVASGQVMMASGVIQTGVNDNWAGNVFVTGDVYVPVGVTLTIAAGTTIRFADRKDNRNLWRGQPLDQAKFRAIQRAELLVAGTLVAQGTRKKLITFTGDWSSKNPKLPYGQWGGIVILGGAVPTTLKYLVITYAEIGITIDNASTIEDSYIMGSWGSLCDRPSVLNPPNHWDVRVGVYLRGNGGSTVRNNLILWNTWGIHANTGGSGKTPITIARNWICLNSTRVAGFDVPNGIHIFRTVAVIENNWISHNTWGVEVGKSIVKVRDNTFTFNDYGFVWYFENDEAICKPSILCGNLALGQRRNYVKQTRVGPLALPAWWFCP